MRKYAGRSTDIVLCDATMEDNMGKPEYYVSSDYAGLSTDNFTAYYGYEETDENDEWCFTAEFGDVKIKVPFSKLKAEDSCECANCLMIGIGWVLTKYTLSVT